MEPNLVAGLSSLGREEVKELSRNWWVLLIDGIISVIAGIIILSINWTLSSLAYFLGAFLIVRGVLQVFSPMYIGTSRSWNVAVGIASILVGIGVLASPPLAGIALITLASIIGAWLIVSGAAVITGSIPARDVLPYWWLALIWGVLSLVLGIFALYRPILTLAVVVALVGIWAIVAGTIETASSLEIRRLPAIIEQQERSLERTKRGAA